MKRISVALFLLVGMFLCMPMTVSAEPEASTKPKVLVEAIQLKKYDKTLTIKKGERLKLKVAVSPKKADNKKLKWKSSNKKVVSVSSKGVIKGRKKGRATITASTTDGSKKRIKLKVIVGTKVSGIEINNRITELKKGSTYKLDVTVAPAEASNKKIIWSSSDEKIAKIDSTGKITAKGQGKVKIIGKATDGSGVLCSMSFSVVVYVKNIKMAVDKPNAYHIPAGNPGAYVKCGDSFIIDAVVQPEEADDQRLIWSSDNPNVAVVSSGGVVSAVGCGVAVVTVEALDAGHKKNKFTVYVGKLSGTECEYVAHRGRSELAPENSLAAIGQALAGNFDGVEFDIWKTIDDEFVVSHDRSLLRMCNVDVDITQLTLQQAISYKIVAGEGIGQYPNEYIPSLDQVLHLASIYPDKTLYIELKEYLSLEMISKLLKKLDDYDMLKRVKIISGQASNLTAIRSMEDYGGEKLALEYVRQEPDMEAVDFCIINNINLSANYLKITEEQIRALHEKGVKVNVWNIPNFWVACHMINNMKVDAITSDYQFAN